MTDSDAPIDDAEALELAGIDPERVAELPIAELREGRDHAVETETGLSYLRRLVQGPLDLVRRELERRASGEHADIATLVEDLPSVLAETSAHSAGGRLPRTLEPGEIDPELAAELDGLIRGGTRIAELPDAGDAELVDLAKDLDVLERKVSRKRRALHRTIDLLNGELARRYSTGEVTVESALADPAE